MAAGRAGIWPERRGEGCGRGTAPSRAPRGVRGRVPNADLGGTMHGGGPGLLPRRRQPSVGRVPLGAPALPARNHAHNPPGESKRQAAVRRPSGGPRSARPRPPRAHPGDLALADRPRRRGHQPPAHGPSPPPTGRRPEGVRPGRDERPARAHEGPPGPGQGPRRHGPPRRATGLHPLGARGTVPRADAGGGVARTPR